MAFRPAPRSPRTQGFTLVELMVVVVLISIMVGLAGPAMMDTLADSRAGDLTLQVVNLYNGARARATGSGRSQLVRFTGAANGGQGGLIAYEGNNSSCNASNWGAIVAAGCGPGGFCTEQLNPAERQVAGEVLTLSVRSTGAANSFGETAADVCYEPTGVTFWRSGTSVAGGLLMSSSNGGATGTLRGGFLMRVQRLEGIGGTQLSVDRQLAIPVGAAARVVL